MARRLPHEPLHSLHRAAAQAQQGGERLIDSGSLDQINDAFQGQETSGQRGTIRNVSETIYYYGEAGGTLDDSLDYEGSLQYDASGNSLSGQAQVNESVAEGGAQSLVQTGIRGSGGFGLGVSGGAIAGGGQGGGGTGLGTGGGGFSGGGFGSNIAGSGRRVRVFGGGGGSIAGGGGGSAEVSIRKFRRQQQQQLNSVSGGSSISTGPGDVVNATLRLPGKSPPALANTPEPKETLQWTLHSHLTLAPLATTAPASRAASDVVDYNDDGVNSALQEIKEENMEIQVLQIPSPKGKLNKINRINELN